MLLSGMGRDGAEGLRALREAGAWTIVQTPESCVVDSMPAAALRIDAVEERLEPSLLAARLASLQSD